MSIAHQLDGNACHDQPSHTSYYCTGSVLIIRKPPLARGDHGSSWIGLKVTDRNAFTYGAIAIASHEPTRMVGSVCIHPGQLHAGVASLVADDDPIDMGDRHNALAFKQMALFKPVPVEQPKDGSQNRDPANKKNAEKRCASKGHQPDYRTIRAIANAAKNVYGYAICMKAGHAT